MRVEALDGAGGRTRTGTVSPPVDFESTTSANSIPPANQCANVLYNKEVIKSSLSQEKLAEILEVSPRMMSYYCSGQRKPTQRKLLRLIRVAGVNVEDIPF